MQRDINVNSASPQDSWDWRDSIWARLIKRRVGSFHFGVEQGFPFLNELILAKGPKIDFEQIGPTKIYRVDTLEHVLSMIGRNRLWLPSPSSWEDPWEDPIRRHIDSSARPDDMAFDCFALCFSTQPSCEAIWQRMKSKGRIVRIETTVEKLLSSIKIPDEDDIAEIDKQVFFGSVDYLDNAKEKQFQQEISRFLNRDEGNGKTDIARVASLFVKRKPFEYEQEFRLVFRPKRLQGIQPRCFYELDLDPKALIESVQIDPWCGDYEYKMIARQFGFDFSKSTLAMPIMCVSKYLAPNRSLKYHNNTKSAVNNT